MDKFVITGQTPLKGETFTSGAKNASLALMPAALLAAGKTTLSNTPRLNDVFTMIKLLTQLGAVCDFQEHDLTIDTSHITSQEAPYEAVKKMRASIYVLGPLLARYGYAKVSLPGGCAWGPRPVDLHIQSMKKLGADIEFENGYIIAHAKRLKGNTVSFDRSSVGATGNLLMAAVLAQGKTVINNASMEPEITNLANMLNLMGAKIYGLNSSILEIEGVDELHPARIETIPDRIEAGTLLTAAAITHGVVTVHNCAPIHLLSPIAKLEEVGAKISVAGSSITLDASGINLSNIDVTTAPFPGFPTDMQAQWIALMSVANGVSTITDTIYLDRFAHVSELNRLGADITVKDNSAIVKGKETLKGAKVMSTDLRASASLVLGGMAAQGTTEVLRVYHLDRGYENLEQKLKSLGAQIERVAGAEY
jgi:UDP-N-acetylglucosamine 1-carboxyvinyltransferase